MTFAIDITYHPVCRDLAREVIERLGSLPEGISITSDESPDLTLEGILFAYPHLQPHDARLDGIVLECEERAMELMEQDLERRKGSEETYNLFAETEVDHEFDRWVWDWLTSASDNPGEALKSAGHALEEFWTHGWQAWGIYYHESNELHENHEGYLWDTLGDRADEEGISVLELIGRDNTISTHSEMVANVVGICAELVAMRLSGEIEQYLADFE